MKHWWNELDHYDKARLIAAAFLIFCWLISLACLAPVATIDTKPADMTAKIQSTAAPRQMVVCRTDPAHGLNLRTDAGTQFESLGVYPNDTVVTLTGAKKTPVVVDWYQVEIGGVTGWMFSSNLCEVK